MISYILYAVVGGITLGAFIFILGIKWWKSDRKPDDDTNDGDGGIKIPNTPDLDLPPGICLPDSPVLKDEILI